MEDGEPTKTPCEAKLGWGDEMETLVQLQIDAKNDPDFTEPGRDINNARPTRKPEDNGFFIATSYKTTRFPLPPSSKLTVAMAVVTQWLAENPDDKIISEYTCHRYTTIYSNRCSFYPVYNNRETDGSYARKGWHQVRLLLCHRIHRQATSQVH
jgi:hypothetical protein